MALELQRRDIVLGLCDQVHRHEPGRQRQLAGLEDRAGNQAALVAAHTALEVQAGAAAELAVLDAAADRANEATGPARIAQNLLALLLGAVLIKEFEHRQARLQPESVERGSRADRIGG